MKDESSHHIDVEMAFLNDDLEEDYIVQQKKGEEQKVLRLKKVIYKRCPLEYVVYKKN